MNTNKGNPLALLPLGIFLVIFVGSGIITGDFYYISILIPALLAAIVAILQNRKKPTFEKVEQFAKGAGHPDIMIMVFIFILAGAFSSVANSIGAVDSTVNLALTYLPENLIIVGVFIIAGFISLSMGTSVGTISALAPIAVGISAETEFSAALSLAAVVGGAMFGDNLSIISDTTIAAVRTQKTEMKDKFKTNFFIVLPAAILTIILLIVLTSGGESSVNPDSFNGLKVIPYIGVLIGALAGLNVMAVLIGGILLSGVIGGISGDYSLDAFMTNITSGINSMSELIFLTIIIGGIVAMINQNGGIQFLLHTLTKGIRSKKGAEGSIAGLVATTNLATANNTIAIITTGQLAKNVADEYEIDSRKSASLLDIFSCTVQGLIPYGAQLLTAAQIGELSPIELLPYSFYPILIAVSGIVAILVGFPRFKKAAA
ncbi:MULTISPECIES: Na+/H+ antiporter NhaC family protein [Pontibacillus]|uniref:Na+/H+ antiporter NhaC family protein n=1 Tax=Pontibacillus chungwhensis TaxID=265426 RepID=A0ABY8V157_9BACI|nr:MULTISPECIES: Na+/H+ antiporter NhaC family protein [Pontibacillus]MCD5322391.1 Na+/H+ antiporter NhaC family protein [Pontibacillus sp. HN14]WIF99677.1 Na+/H+ antiporter NhaC family protein [Pontibacillus chungwhensis]